MLVRIALITVVASSASARAETCLTTDEQKKCAAACDAKQYDVCAKLGLAYINSGDVAARPRGVALLEKACTNNSPLGCGGLGSLHIMGVGVARDAVRGVKLLETGCKGADALSCESLGGWYAQGAGGDPAKLDLPASMARAAPYYDRACTLKRPAACAFLASFIMEGAKFPGADRKRVPALLETACRGEVNVACKFLGDVYNKGELVRRDAKKANELYAKACKLGYDRGCSAKAD